MTHSAGSLPARLCASVALLALLAAYGSSDAGDLKGDGETAVDDLLMLVAAWGDCG